MDHSFGTFLFLCFLLTITPGSDTALVLKSAITGGNRSFILTSFGICTGLLVHATLSSLGLSAILQQSAELYSFVKMLGAGYLIYLGVVALKDVFGKKSGEAAIISSPTQDAFIRKAAFTEFRIGLLTNILNPKVAVFYLTFLPQFVDVRGNVLLQSLGLACAHIAMSLVWLFAIGCFVGFFRAQLSKPSVRRKIEAVTGFALLGFGLRLALSRD